MGQFVGDPTYDISESYESLYGCICWSAFCLMRCSSAGVVKYPRGPGPVTGGAGVGVAFGVVAGVGEGVAVGVGAGVGVVPAPPETNWKLSNTALPGVEIEAEVPPANSVKRFVIANEGETLRLTFQTEPSALVSKCTLLVDGSCRNRQCRCRVSKLVL